jgi:hypothetical protein
MTMKKESANKQTRRFPVREGSDEGAVPPDMKPAQKDQYPQSSKEDKQQKNQPEFTEEQPNRESPSSPADLKNKNKQP